MITETNMQRGEVVIDRGALRAAGTALPRAEVAALFDEMLAMWGPVRPEPGTVRITITVQSD